MGPRSIALSILLLVACGGSAFKAGPGNGSADGGSGGSDGATAEDGGPVIGTDGGPVGPFCAAHAGHEACFDFEGTGFPPSPLAGSSAGGGTYKRDTALGSSSTASLSTATPSGNTAHAAVTYSWNKTSKKYFELSFDLYVDQLPSAGSPELTGLFITPNAGTYQVYFALNGDNLVLRQFAGSGNQDTDLGNIQTKTWVRLQLVVDLRGQPVAKSSKIDGSPVSVNLSPLPTSSYDAQLIIGVSYVAPSTGATAVHQDNFLIDSQ